MASVPHERTKRQQNRSLAATRDVATCTARRKRRSFISRGTPLVLATILMLPDALSSAPTTISLAPISPEAATKHLREASASSGGALRLGFGRTIRAPLSAQGTAQKWTHTGDDRHVLVLRVVSPGAAGVRVALRIDGLPDTATLRFGTDELDEGHSQDGVLVNRSLRADRQAGVTDPLVWSPIMKGDSLRLTVTLPAGTDPREVRIEPTMLSHMVRLPGVSASGEEKIARAPTPTDPACDPNIEQPSRASGLLLYTDPDGATGACSGVLVNSTDGDIAHDVVLTAHHCVSTQERASSLESRWLLFADICGGTAPQGVVATGGADLTTANKSTDSVLLRLRQIAPAGTRSVERADDLPPPGTPVVGLHHSRAQPLTLAIGTISRYLNCEEIDYCADTYDPNAIHYLRVQWTAGRTLAGSSGSGLFDADGRILGVLAGGPSCPPAECIIDDYGRITNAP